MSPHVLASISKHKSWINLECRSSALCDMVDSPALSVDVDDCVGWRVVAHGCGYCWCPTWGLEQPSRESEEVDIGRCTVALATFSFHDCIYRIQTKLASLGMSFKLGLIPVGISTSLETRSRCPMFLKRIKLTNFSIKLTGLKYDLISVKAFTFSHCLLLVFGRSQHSNMRQEMNARWAQNSCAELTQVMANMLMHFDTLAKHNTVNSKRYAAMLSIVIKESEIRFQDCKKNISWMFWFISNSIFSWHKYMTCEFSSGMYRVAMQNVITSFYQTSVREKHLSLHSHTLFVSPLFGSASTCEQL